MIDREEFYKIEAFSQKYITRIIKLSRSREILKDKSFLSASHSILVGEKGVGKTTLIIQKALKDKDRFLYISLDNSLFSNHSLVDYAQVAKSYGYDLIVFDEIHRYHNWKTDLKVVIDTIDIKIVSSGSSILSFDNLGGLARRILKYSLKGISFREWLNLSYQGDFEQLGFQDLIKNHYEVSKSILEKISVVIKKPIGVLFEEYLKKGYYAYSLELETENFLALLKQSTEDTISSEIVLSHEHTKGLMSRRLQAIFKVISEQVPFTLDYKRLRELTGISDDKTTKYYLDCLYRAGVLLFLEKKSLKGLRKLDKIYLGNTCLYYAYADTLAPNIGSIRENFFLNTCRLIDLDVISHNKSADFEVEGIAFEVGGKSKNTRQIKNEKHAFVVKDIYEIDPNPKVIPLWAFGFLG